MEYIRQGSLSARYVAALVLAAAAPFTAVLGVTPLAFAYGNGTGLPATFLLVGAAYLLFVVGMSALAARSTFTGGLYALVRMGLGRRMGGAAGLIAVAAYVGLSLATFCLCGAFAARIAADQFGLAVPWQLCAAAAALLVYAFGRRQIEFNGLILLVLMAAEVALLMSLAASVLSEAPASSAFAFSSPFVPGLGVSLIFIVTMFLGFEAAAVFAGEMRNAKRGVPVATATAVILISVVYCISTWTIGRHFGGENIVGIAASDPVGLYRTAFVSQFGPLGGKLTDIVLITSLFACLLAFHNSISQYGLALARDGLAPRSLEFRHPAFGSPSRCGHLQTVFTLLFLGASLLFISDPFAIIAPAGALSAISILSLQIIVCVSAIRFFSQHTDRPHIAIWLLAPAGASFALLAMFWSTLANLPLLTGGSNLMSAALIAIILVLATIGFARGVTDIAVRTMPLK